MRCYVFLSDESLFTWRNYNTLNGSRLTGLTCCKTPGFWMVEHQLVLLVSIIGYKDVWKIEVCCLWRSLFNHIVWNTDKVVCLLFVVTSYFNIFSLLQVHTECITMKVVEWDTWKWGECCSTESRRLTELKSRLCICGFTNYLIIYCNYRNIKACKVDAKWGVRITCQSV